MILEEEIIEQMLEESEGKEYFLELGNHLADTYESYFTDTQIEKLYNPTLSLEATKLYLPRYFFDPKDLAYLQFSELQKLIINENTYIIFDLKGQVKEFVIEKEMQHALNLNLLNALQILELRSIPINLNELAKEMQKLIVTSLVYNYAFQKLKENSKDKLDIMRAGMFKNAYYNIIGLNSQEYCKKFLNMPLQAPTR